MKTMYLISNNPKEGSTYLYLEVKDRLENFGDLQKEGIIDKQIFTSLNAQSMQKFNQYLGKCNTKVNFSKLSAKGPVIDSPMTQKFLLKPSLTCCVICYNLQGEKQGLICSDNKGNLYNLSMNYVLNSFKSRKNIINNLFLRNGKELVLTQGNYNAQGPMVPIMYLGTKLNKNSINPQENIDGLKEDKKYDLEKLKQYKAPVQAMIVHGYKPYVNMFKLDNVKIPEENLWFYYTLLKNGEYKYVGNLVSDKKYSLGQLEQLYLGLKSGVNITKYKDPSIEVDEMIRVRKHLEDGSFNGVIIPKRVKDLMTSYAMSGYKNKEEGKAIDQILSKIKKVYK